MTDIVIAEPIEEGIVRELGARFEVRYDGRLAADRAALRGALAQARALIVGDRIVIDEELLAAAPRLQVIGCLRHEPRQVDEEACRARGIEIHRVPQVQETTRAEQVANAVLELLRRAGRPASDRSHLLGLVGFGTVARHVAERALAQGLRVAAYDPLREHDDPIWERLGVTPMPLHRLLEEADAVSLHVPLTEETHELIDWTAITEMRPGAVLVNASRSALVDAAAVHAALRSGRLGGAVLDLDTEAADVLALPWPRIDALIAERVQATLEGRQPT